MDAEAGGMVESEATPISAVRDRLAGLSGGDLRRLERALTDARDLFDHSLTHSEYWHVVQLLYLIYDEARRRSIPEVSRP